MTNESQRRVSDELTLDPEDSKTSRTDPTETTSEQNRTGSSLLAAGGLMSATWGVLFSACFYLLVWFVPWAPMQRYFLGHPIAAAATVLFWFGVAVLVSKWFAVADQSNRLSSIQDDDLRPSLGDESPANRWLEENDAGHVARGWLKDLSRLPAGTRSSLFVHRLEELLTRQSQRGTAKHLADDLRELSSRDADAAHDSLGLVRIIVWAIPMLGFLGTVIGITQTLGGLDFSNGTAAVDNLKSGLYVAFDTTALGLVLSVIAIFLQFPVERSEQKLLAEIDARVGHLASENLPGDEASDNQTVLIADLCKGVQAAVAESLDNQAKLWRETIDTAQQQWQAAHDHNTNRLAEAFELTLVPALIEHGEMLSDSSRAAAKQLSAECEKWQAVMDDAHAKLEASNDATALSLVESLDKVLKPALRDHAGSLDESSQLAADRLERTWSHWQESMEYHSGSMTSQQEILLRHFEALNETQQSAEAITSVQHSLQNNLERLDQTNQAIDKSIHAAAGYGMADAMRILARAVDVLSTRLADTSENDKVESSSRRAA